MSTEVPATPTTIPSTPRNSPTNTSLLQVINDPLAVLDHDYAIGTPLVSSSPETIDMDSDSDSDEVEQPTDTGNPDSCYHEVITPPSNSETTQLQDQIDQLTIRVKADDTIISGLLGKLQENQNQYNKLVNNRKFCPWSWWQKASDYNYLTYGIVGMIVIIGGSNAIFR